MHPSGARRTDFAERCEAPSPGHAPTDLAEVEEITEKAAQMISRSAEVEQIAEEATSTPALAVAD